MSTELFVNQGTNTTRINDSAEEVVYRHLAQNSANVTIEAHAERGVELYLKRTPKTALRVGSNHADADEMGTRVATWHVRQNDEIMCRYWDRSSTQDVYVYWRIRVWN